MELPKLNVRPLFDKIVVLPDPEATESEGGVLIPETARERQNSGTVIVVGQGKDDEPMLAERGDRIFFGKNAGTDLYYKGKDYLLMRQSDILIFDYDGK